MTQMNLKSICENSVQITLHEQLVNYFHFKLVQNPILKKCLQYCFYNPPNSYFYYLSLRSVLSFQPIKHYVLSKYQFLCQVDGGSREATHQACYHLLLNCKVERWKGSFWASGSWQFKLSIEMLSLERIFFFPYMTLNAKVISV